MEIFDGPPEVDHEANAAMFAQPYQPLSTLLVFISS